MEKKPELTTLEEFKPVVSLQKKTAGGIPAILNSMKFVMSEAGMLRGTRHYEPISWNGAFDLIASELNALPSPDQAVFYTSGRTSNEAAYTYQLFTRTYGTNNLPGCSNMCHESSGVALTGAIGIGKASVTLNDFDHADCILVIEQNPGTNHPRILTTSFATSLGLKKAMLGERHSKKAHREKIQSTYVKVF